MKSKFSSKVEPQPVDSNSALVLNSETQTTSVFHCFQVENNPQEFCLYTVKANGGEWYCCVLVFLRTYETKCAVRNNSQNACLFRCRKESVERK